MSGLQWIKICELFGAKLLIIIEQNQGEGRGGLKPGHTRIFDESDIVRLWILKYHLLSSEGKSKEKEDLSLFMRHNGIFFLSILEASRSTWVDGTNHYALFCVSLERKLNLTKEKDKCSIIMPLLFHVY